MLERSRPTRAGAVRASLTVVAVVIGFCTMLAVGHVLRTGTQPALLCAILTLGVSRRPEHARAMHAALYPLSLAAVAVVAGGVGLLLHRIPIVGAIVFVAGIFLSIWLRNFGERARRIGALIALPFVAMLVVPVGPIRAPGGPLVDLAAIVFAGLVALAAVRVVGLFASLARIAKPTADVAIERPARKSKPGAISVPTRMALQMTVALALAFVIGLVFFSRHWGWTVLTAFIVCSGAIGRADAAYKGFLRLLGAIVGTASATLLTHLWHPRGPLEAAGVFVALFLGLWLRDTNYAYWAACITLVLALLSQPAANVTTSDILTLRLLAIFVGALCAIVATWFVLPIRTTDVIRRRLSDVLVALDAFVASDVHDRDARSERLSAFDHRMRDLNRVATPVRLHRRVVRVADHAEHPGRWLDIAREFHMHAHANDGEQLTPERKTRIRRAIGSSRKAIGAHGKTGAEASERGISACLDDVCEALRARPSPAS